MNTLASEEISQRQLHLLATGVFSGLSENALNDLEEKGVYMEYHQEMVTATGQELSYLFFILQGNFEVSKVETETAKKIVLATIGVGQCFGEMSFFAGTPASANVIAVGTVICWAIPHASLREFIENHKGGARLAMNMGALLANRVQEGNARLIGLNASLSAYFGHQARRQVKAAVPKSNQAAEMEVPDELFDQFIRETLKLGSRVEITDQQRQKIRSKIEANEIDIVPWLEKGGRGDRFKMRLKLVEETSSSREPSFRRPSSTLLQPTLLRIPQIRDQVIASQRAQAKQSTSWNWVQIGSYVALPILTIIVVVLLLPLRTRESFLSSNQFKDLPLHSSLEKLMIRNAVQKYSWTMQKGAVQSVQMSLPKTASLKSTLHFSQLISTPLNLRITIKQTASKSILLDQRIELKSNQDTFDLFSTELPNGSYLFECTCEDWPDGISLPSNAEISVKS